MEGPPKTRQEWESKCSCVLPSPACQPRECAGSPLQTPRWEPPHTRSHAWCSAWPQCLVREGLPWRLLGITEHKTSLCPNNEGPVPFRQAYPQIISEHVGSRSFRLSSLLASLSSQPGESDHPLPSLWSTPRSNSSAVATNKEREKDRRNYPELLDAAFLYFLSFGLWSAIPQRLSSRKVLH